MTIHIVAPGDSIYSIAVRCGVSMSRLMEDNGLSPAQTLVVGQALVVQRPALTHTVVAGDTLWHIAEMHGISLRQLWRNNPALEGGSLIYPGQTLVVQYEQAKTGTLSVLGYAYPSVDPALLRATVPYLTDLSPFTYSVTADGGLIPLDDAALLQQARDGGAAALFHLSNLIEGDGFSGELVHPLLNSTRMQDRLMDQIQAVVEEKGYQGIDVDFEAVLPEDAVPYAKFIGRLRARFSPAGLPIFVALVAKTSRDQSGPLYEGHDYRLLGEAADALLLMTYEWGYAYGPPMAVAPLDKVRQVVEYAVTEIPREKLWLGIPNYGYVWPLPFVQGTDRARSISNVGAVDLARRRGAAIAFDDTAQSPWFRYWGEDGREYEVWFEDARSIRAKLALAEEYGLYGVGYWNLMRPFPQNWRVLNALYDIRDPS